MRSKLRIKKIMKLFRNDGIAFSKFIGLDTEDEYFKIYRKNFLDRYEEIFYYWQENFDQRFGQLLINLGVIPDGYCWNIEDEDWVLENNYFKPKEILTWGSYGIDGDKNYKEWLKEKPQLNQPIEIIDRYLYPGIEKKKRFEIYALRFESWRKRAPKPYYRFLEELDTSHIEAILKTEKLSDVYIKAFEEILGKRNV